MPSVSGMQSSERPPHSLLAAQGAYARLHSVARISGADDIGEAMADIPAPSGGASVRS